MTEQVTVSETDYQTMRQKFAPAPIQQRPQLPPWSGPAPTPPQTHPVAPPCPPTDSYVPPAPEFGADGHQEWYMLAVNWDRATRLHDEAVLHMIQGAKWKAKFIDIVGHIA